MASHKHSCPMADLYVARMDDSLPDVELLTVKFSTQVAILDALPQISEIGLTGHFQAVEWAMNMGLDMISMSWTFRKLLGDKSKGSGNGNNGKEASPPQAATQA